MKFGIVVRPNAPIEILAARSRRAEELGFDQLWTEDHTRDYRDAKGEWFNGWIALERSIDLFVPAGVEEFVMFWPPDDKRDMLERVASQVIPAFKED